MAFVCSRGMNEWIIWIKQFFKEALMLTLKLNVMKKTHSDASEVL